MTPCQFFAKILPMRLLTYRTSYLAADQFWIFYCKQKIIPARKSSLSRWFTWRGNSHGTSEMLRGNNGHRKRTIRKFVNRMRREASHFYDFRCRCVCLKQKYELRQDSGERNPLWLCRSYISAAHLHGDVQINSSDDTLS